MQARVQPLRDCKSAVKQSVNRYLHFNYFIYMTLFVLLSTLVKIYYLVFTDIIHYVLGVNLSLIHLLLRALVRKWAS